jgi:hypothetical protein
VCVKNPITTTSIDDADATVAVVVVVVVIVVSFIHISSLFFAFLLSFHDAASAATGHFFKKELKRVVEQKNGKKVVRYSFLGFFLAFFYSLFHRFRPGKRDYKQI